MASKTIEEFLKSASKEQRGELDKLSQDLQNRGVEERQAAPPGPPQRSQELVERSDVQQINQDWQQGKEVKIEKVSDKSDLALADSQVPKASSSKSGPYDHPQFMDEQRQSQQPGPTEQTPPGASRDQTGQRPPNAVQEVLASAARRESQTKTQEPQKSQTKSQEPER